MKVLHILLFLFTINLANSQTIDEYKLILKLENQVMKKANEGDYSEALKDANELVAISSNRASSYYWRSYAKRRSDDLIGAMHDINKAIQIGPDDHKNISSRAYIKHELKDYRGAIKDCENAIILYNNYQRFKEANDLAHIYLTKGRSEIKLGRLETGCLSLSKAGELGIEYAYKLIEENCN